MTPTMHVDTIAVYTFVWQYRHVTNGMECMLKGLYLLGQFNWWIPFRGKLVFPRIGEESSTRVDSVATQFPFTRVFPSEVCPYITKDNAIDGAHQIRIVRVKIASRTTILLVIAQTT